MNISNEVWEAAARAAAKDEDDSNWADEPEYYRTGWMNRVLPALTAAAPHLMAAAWDEGWDAAAGWPQKETNPYRAIDATLKAGEYTDKAGQKWVRCNSDSQNWTFDDGAGGVWVARQDVLAAKIIEESS